MKKYSKKKPYGEKHKKLWNIFDIEINKKKGLQCLYSNNSNRIRGLCDLCENMLHVSEEGYFTCSNKKCGIIYKDILDDKPEWRYYGAKDNNICDPTRCGMPINPLLEKSSYGCKVVCYSNSSYEMRKIRRYTEWQAMPYKEKSQYDEFEYIKGISRLAGISKIIVDEALCQHKKISEQKTFRGLNRDGIIAASIYIACKKFNSPRTAKEIATIFNLNNSSATKGCKNAMHIINDLEKNMCNMDKTYFCETRPSDFIERYCSKLYINEELTEVCKFIAHRIFKNNIIPENTPHSVAAGIIYLISQIFNLNINKKHIFIISEISEVTINKCYKKLYELRHQLIPSIILQKYHLK